MSYYYCKDCDQTIQRPSNEKYLKSNCSTSNNDVLLKRVDNAGLKPIVKSKPIATKGSQMPKDLVEKIVQEIKAQHDRRYGSKMKDGRYVPMRNTYKTEHLYDDMVFILNHIHF